MKRDPNLPKLIKSKNPVVILKAVIKAIEEEPRRYDQGTYINRIDSQFRQKETSEFPACGTICCVAGWVNTLTNPEPLSYDEQEEAARDTLRLSWDEALELFDGAAVPDRMPGRVGAHRHAKAGVKHIKKFVLEKWGKVI